MSGLSLSYRLSWFYADNRKKPTVIITMLYSSTQHHSKHFPLCSSQEVRDLYGINITRSSRDNSKSFTIVIVSAVSG